MSEISSFGIVLLFFIFGLIFLLISLGLSKFIRPNRPNPEKGEAYETGEQAIGSPWGNFNIRFYLIALLFVLFDVEIVFLFPWGIVFGQEALIEATNGTWGWFALIEMFVFVGILALGLAFAWVKGFLDWSLPAPEQTTVNTPVPSNHYDKINQKYSNTKSQ